MRFARQVDGADGGERAIRGQHDAVGPRCSRLGLRHQLLHGYQAGGQGVGRDQCDGRVHLDLVGRTAAAGDGVHYRIGGDKVGHRRINEGVVARAAVQNVDPHRAGEGVGTAAAGNGVVTRTGSDGTISRTCSDVELARCTGNGPGQC